MERTIYRRHFLVTVVACWLGLIATSPASADEGGSEGITVIGDGVVKAKPTVIEIMVNVSGEAELAGDARVKYHDAKKKGLAALEALKIPELSVKSEGPAISEATNAQLQMRVMQGVATGEAKPKVQISEALRIRITGVDKLDPDQILETALKVIDTCHDAGLQVGPPAAGNIIQMQIRAQSGAADTLLNFKIPDKTDLENRAYEQAVANAKAKAERIAKLNGVKLGRVLSVRDQAAAAAGPGNQRQLWAAMVYGGMSGDTGESDTQEVSSQDPGEIAVSVHVAMTFEIAK